MPRRLITVLALLMSSACATSSPDPDAVPPSASTPLPAPTPIAVPPEPPMAVREHQRAMAELGRALDELEPVIGDWPPAVSDETDRHHVFAKWRAALERAQALDRPGAQDPAVLWLVASTWRQGHNLEVKGAAEMARSRFEQCIAVDPAFVECHRGLGRLLLASKPEHAAEAEQHLRHARELYAPSVHPDLERQIALALVMQGKTDEALAHLDGYLVEQPGDVRTRELRGWIADGKLRVVTPD